MPSINKKHLVFLLFILIGLIIGLWWSLPDGKLHVVFCDVGQGDATYIRFPNQVDMLVDGGPDDKVLSCLGRFMPFYDRTLEIVAMTHPQKDHMQGLISVLKRYEVKDFLTIPVKNETEGYKELVHELKLNNTSVRYPTHGALFKVGEANIMTIWPDASWLISQLKLNSRDQARLVFASKQNNILGASSDLDLNQFSLYLNITYDKFDLLLTGDGDQGVQKNLQSLGLFSSLPQNISVLKVPHHGSKAGMIPEFWERLKPRLSVIEVGKNNYGHPNQDVIKALEIYGQVLTTKERGNIEVVSDGEKWEVK